MQLWLDQLANGLTAGAEYALMAAGLTLIFGVLEIVNFAHGEFYMLSAYMLYLFQTQCGLPYGPAALLAIVGMGVFGAIFYLLVVQRILNRGWQVQLVATLAVSMLMLNLAIVLAGPTPRLTSSPYAAMILVLGPVRLSLQRILVLVGAGLSFSVLFAFLKYSKMGKAMRAVAQNREAAAVTGIPVQRVGLYAVVAGSALAGVAGVTISPLYNLQPSMGTMLIIKAFASVIMGGFGNVPGAIICAFVLGLAEAFGVTVIGSDYADVLVFGVMIAVLLFRPSGLFGRVARA